MFICPIKVYLIEKLKAELTEVYCHCTFTTRGWNNSWDTVQKEQYTVRYEAFKIKFSSISMTCSDIFLIYAAGLLLE